MRTPVCTNACQWCISQLLIFSNLLSEKWHLRKVLICIALKSVKMNIYLYLRALCTSFSMNCLFISLAHFFSWVFRFILYIREVVLILGSNIFIANIFLILLFVVWLCLWWVLPCRILQLLISQITKILFHDFLAYACVFPCFS